MNTTNITYPAEKRSLYRLLRTQLQGLTDGVPYMLANLANASALLYQEDPSYLYLSTSYGSYTLYILYSGMTP